jgi:HSP20 family protein
MTTIIRKDDPRMELDPVRALRELMRWDPFREMAPMFREGPWAPSFEVREGKEGYVFKADLPGIKPEDLEIRLAGNRLEFSGKREVDHESKGDTFYAYERSYGTFTRIFTLPDGFDAEHIRTELKEGVLTVAVPKKVEAQPKKITVNAAGPKS